MTDPTGLPPEQEAVRRLLADARHDAPTPPEVVARLEEALASLHAERVAEPAAGIAPVVDLGARRRRLVGVGLVAAAAVVVAGVALGQGLPGTSGGSSDSAASGDTATSQRDSSDDSSGNSSDSGGAAESQQMAPQTRKSGTPAPLAAYPTLSSDDSDLDEEVLGLRSSAYDASSPEAPMSAERQPDCDQSGTGRGRRVLAEVDGKVGVVVFRRADGAAQQVDLYVCGDAQAVRTLTLPAP